MEGLEHKINIVKWANGPSTQDGSQPPKSKVVIAEGLTPKEAYDRFVKPGQMLTLAETMHKGWVRPQLAAMQQLQAPEKFNDYVITKPYRLDTPVVVTGKKAKGHRPGDLVVPPSMYEKLREVHLLLHSPTSYWQEMLDRAYQFLELGCPVEFVIRARNSNGAKKARWRSAGTEQMDYWLAHFPHMRPDVILRSMPAGTKFIIDPVTDGRALQFVLAIPKGSMQDLNERLQNVKMMVTEAIEAGRLKDHFRGTLPSAGSVPEKTSPSEDPSKEAGKLEPASHEPMTAAEEKALHSEWTLNRSRARYMVPVKEKWTAPDPFVRLNNKGKIVVDPKKAVEANRQRQLLNPTIISPAAVEANRQRQKEAAKKAREEAEAKRELSKSRKANRKEKPVEQP